MGRIRTGVLALEDVVWLDVYLHVPLGEFFAWAAGLAGSRQAKGPLRRTGELGRVDRFKDLEIG